MGTIGRIAIGWLCGVVVLLAGPASRAQEFQLALQRGPYYVGEPVVLQVVAKGFTDGQQPSCRLQGPSPDGISIEGPQVNRSVSSYTQIIGGQIRREETAHYRFSFMVTASRSGSYEIGPFVIQHDGQSTVVEGTSLEFEQLAGDPDMQVSVSLPRSVLYLGEHMPITIRWAFAGDLEEVRYAFSNLQIRSPIFDQFTFKDQSPSTRTTLSIATAKGTVELDAEVSQEEQNGREFIVVTGRRTMVADVVGEFAEIPVTCRTKKVAGWGRDFFGSLRPSRTVPALASGTRLSFSVRPLPSEGRPESFAGAIGSGFSLDVTANRTVVRVGDPISLNVAVRGDGNLENASLPPLSADGGLSPDQFQLPEEQPVGTFQGNAKQFNVNVRVSDQSVSQIPAVAFSWFDPRQQRYHTTRSKPIALQVMPTQVVSARDVIAATGATRRDEAGGEAASDRAATEVASPLVVQGANLAIEQDPSRLLSGGRGFFSGVWMIAAPYAVGLVAIATAVWIRWRGQRDPEQLRRRNELKQSRRQIAATGKLPRRDAAERIAAALRAIAARSQGPAKTEANALIAECETVIYAPTTANQGETGEDLARRALQVVDALPRG